METRRISRAKTRRKRRSLRSVDIYFCAWGAHTNGPQARRVSIVESVLLSLPSATKYTALFNVAINTFILLLAADFVLYPVLDDAKDVVFTRVGAVYPDSVKLVVRLPAENATENEVRILWRQAPETPEATWHPGPSVSLTAENDWINTIHLDGLWPSTSYEC